ncbi:MAG: hypothetical protein KME16_09955 [Scytolyngbya sp. HA4215-MV1]|jgi:hypothetical protein|nr:hypothetical protein [Scytolyngbya sp. HA4215-MV1]
MNRTLIYTVAALASGCFGFWMGGQFNAAIQQQACPPPANGLPSTCQPPMISRSFWYSSLGGSLASAILGTAVVGSWLNQRTQRTLESPADAPERTLDPSLQAAEVSLSAAQDEVLRCLLALLATQATPEDSITPQNEDLSAQSLVEAHQYLQPLGFSEATIAQAWQMLQTIQAEASDI